ncbi:winged helix-turn-helix domain-containing protein [Streptomyces canus]|uniref:winged helix-turn-helix domain-containing protein n=1 Tax=Streptomyces canus TaxID=58343 RepID=UPI0039A72671
MDLGAGQETDRSALPYLYTAEGTWRLLKRHGWSWQQPRAERSSVTMTGLRCGRRRSGRG